MDYRKSLCKCTQCNTVWIDTIPNTTCLRMSEEEIPKKMETLTEDGCPTCKTWDHLEDVTSLISLKYTNFREAKEKGPIEYPGAIFLKSGLAIGAEKQQYRKMKEYIFVI